MKHLHCVSLLAFLLLSICLSAQTITLLNDNKLVSLRGLSAVTNDIVWVSGNKGTVGRSTDGGRTWEWITVKGFETRDFRDIEAFNETTAVIIAVAEPAVILRTTDGGKNWDVVYENKNPGMFLDAMDFIDERHGTVIGDPIGGKMFLASTNDGGLTWKDADPKDLPAVDDGEACFASSGTNIRLLANFKYVFISGGRKSRVFYNETPNVIPITQGLESTGGNSIAVRQDKNSNSGRWIVVGGDFASDTTRARNCFISIDQGKTWISPTVPPFGYRSCVEFITEKDIITCGTKGVDISTDDGITWKNISPTGFHVCRKAKKGTTVFLAGGNGRIGKLER